MAQLTALHVGDSASALEAAHGSAASSEQGALLSEPPQKTTHWFDRLLWFDRPAVLKLEGPTETDSSTRFTTAFVTVFGVTFCYSVAIFKLARRSLLFEAALSLGLPFGAKVCQIELKGPPRLVQLFLIESTFGLLSVLEKCSLTLGTPAPGAWAFRVFFALQVSGFLAQSTKRP